MNYRTAPTLLTDRLELRAHTIDDFVACFTILSDPETGRHAPGKPLSRQEVWSRILRFHGHWGLLGYGYWVVVERSTQELIGEIGFGLFKRTFLESKPNLSDIPEFGIVLRPSTHNSGYGKEATDAVMQWAKANIAEESIFCLISSENIAAIKIVINRGFVVSENFELDNRRMLLLIKKLR